MWRPATPKGIEVKPGLAQPPFCNYPPAFVVAFSPLAHIDQRDAFWLWDATQFVFLAIAILLLAREADPPLDLTTITLLAALTIVSRPFRGTLIYAQVTPMLLAAMLASWRCSRRRWPALAGLFLALAALLKLFPAAAGGYFLFARRWREAAWAAAFFVAGAIASGVGNWIAFFRYGVTSSAGPLARNHLTALAWTRNVAAPALAQLTGLHIPVAIFATAIAVVLIAAGALQSIRTARQSATQDGVTLGAWIAIALALSPVAWPHETILLLPLYLFASMAAIESIRGNRWQDSRFIAGTVLLAIGLVPELIKAAPNAGFIGIVAAIAGGSLICRASDSST
ncbi:MAG TPA: glycosyltransferase family 87 protein [Candidatus Binatus sp.]|nr:glycosyltransferase family 87 protein [Candidatus Binatus sp.]